MMKRIIFVVDNLEIGGVEKSLVTLLSNLNKKNYKIDVLPLYSYGIYKAKIEKLGVMVLPIPKCKYDSNLIFKSFKVEILKDIKNFKLNRILDILKLCKKSKTNKIVNKMCFSDKVRCSVIKEYSTITDEYDIAISYIDRYYSYYVMDKINAKKKIMWIHSDYDAMKNSITNYNDIYSNFNKIICVSEKARLSFLKKFPCLNDKTITINNMIDIDTIDNTSKASLKNDGVKIISVGRLSKEKRYMELVKLFAEVKKRITTNATLYIIGDGPEKRKIKKLIEKQGLNNNVVLLGKKENPYGYMKSSDIYVQPSVKEGFCLSVYEALYLNKYVIAYNFADTQKIIKNGINGCICNNDYEFIEGIVNAINNIKYKKVKKSIDKKYNNDIVLEVEKVL